MTGKNTRLKEIRLPQFGSSATMPELEPSLYRERLQALRKAMRSAELDLLVLYADREHCANLAWLTGYDPRFEEALAIVSHTSDPVLIAGPENQGSAAGAPLALDVRLYPPFGLMGQERAKTPPLTEVLREAGLASGLSVGVAGWKYFGPFEASDPVRWLEIPSYIADTVRAIAGAAEVVNAGALFMDPQDGLRATTDIDELARFEFAACHVSDGVRRVVTGTRPGMREFDAAQLMAPIGLPLSCHAMFSSGERAWLGLPSPTSKTIGRGEAVTTAYGVAGALSCRNGWLVESEDELPEAIRDYLPKLVFPYFNAVADWLETLAIGVTGGKLHAAAMRHVGDPFFGVGLNPGHLLHLDEWMHSPVAAGSKSKLKSGMAIQCDIIPATGGPYFTINVEDGFALLNDKGRAQFAEKYPQAWARIEARRAFMADELGIMLKPETLPLSNMASHLPPFWLSPDRAVTRR